MNGKYGSQNERIKRRTERDEEKVARDEGPVEQDADVTSSSTHGYESPKSSEVIAVVLLICIFLPFALQLIPYDKPIVIDSPLVATPLDVLHHYNNADASMAFVEFPKPDESALSTGDTMKSLNADNEIRPQDRNMLQKRSYLKFLQELRLPLNAAVFVLKIILTPIVFFKTRLQNGWKDLKEFLFSVKEIGSCTILD